MFRSLSTLALIVLTSTLATAQVPGAAKQIDPKAVASGVKAPTQIQAQAKLGNLNPGDLNVDVTKFARRNVAISSDGLVINEAAQSVTITVKNTGTIQENSVAVRLGIADAIDGTKIFIDQTKGSGPIPAGGSKSVTFTSLNFATFKQQVVQQFGPTNGNKLVVVAQADPKGFITEANEDDNATFKFLK